MSYNAYFTTLDSIVQRDMAEGSHNWHSQIFAIFISFLTDSFTSLNIPVHCVTRLAVITTCNKLSTTNREIFAFFTVRYFYM